MSSRDDDRPTGSPDLTVSRRGFLKGGVGATVGLATGASTTALPATAEAGGGPTSPGSPGSSGAIPGLTRVEVATKINGEPVVVEVGPDESALDLLRERLQLTGAKRGCGHGACGACAVHLDGAPVATCLLPASALHGREVRTVEGLDAGLHPVQRAFLAEDALQCGFCTPGFVMESVAFVDRWRSEQGDLEPPTDAVQEALAGHICRCGAYPGILRAVQGACAGRFDEPGFPPHDRLEGLSKVRGVAKYTADVVLDGTLHGAIVRSPHSNAVVDSVDLGPALALDGVVGAVLLMEPGSRVRFAGQEVAAVAANDSGTALTAARRILVGYTTEPSVALLDDARAERAPLVFPACSRGAANVRKEAANHDTPRPHPGNAAEVPDLVPLGWDRNVRGPMGVFALRGPDARKRVEQARTAGEGSGTTLVEGRWRSQVQCHTALEPHTTLARWEGEQLTVWMSTQACSDMADDIATHFRLKRGNVRVLCENVGGGFGAKCRLGQETVAAVRLAKETGAPVRISLERGEELTVGGVRPEADMELAMVASSVGSLAAMELTAHHGSGAAVGHNVGVFFRLMYPGASKSLRDFDVVTHTPPAEPFRGPGGPPAFWALEQSVDELAIELGSDPLELRRKWDPSPPRRDLYDALATAPMWLDRGPVAAQRGRFRRGVGLAASTWFYFVQPHMQVQVANRPSGFEVRCATQDMGQGTRTMLASAVGSVLGVPHQQITVRVGDSDFVRGPVSSGSRTTASLAPAAEDAANQLAGALASVAAVMRGLDDAVPRAGGVQHAGGLLPWSELLPTAPEMSFIGRRGRDPGGWFIPFAVNDLLIGRTLPGAVTASEVEVDTRLGTTRVLRVWAGIGVGRIYAPTLARSQVHGGVIQGIGYALHEERRLDRSTGRLITANLEDYRVPGIADSPEIEVHFAEGHFEEVLGGGVGLGELCTVGVPASIGNAVHHATGWRARELPIRPDRLLRGVGP